jgi:hypothetical protein
MAGSSKDQVPRGTDSPCLSPLGTCFILFKVYFADDTVLALDSELDPRLFATFGSAPIIRFHGYTPGNSYCVYELLTAFAMPVNVSSIGDLIAARIQSLTQLDERALLATLFESSNHVGLRVYRFLRVTGRRDHVRLLEEEPVADPQYDGRLIVEFMVDNCWRLIRPMPRGFANCRGLACSW